MDVVKSVLLYGVVNCLGPEDLTTQAASHTDRWAESPIWRQLALLVAQVTGVMAKTAAESCLCCRQHITVCPLLTIVTFVATALPPSSHVHVCM